MRIQHNIAALNSHRQLTGNNNAVSKNLEKLSSGYRINRAGDDAAGLAISEKMRAQITGLKTAQKNANDGISLVQTAEGALTEVHSMLNRMIELADQSANGTYDNEVDRANLQKEVQSLKEEIDRISEGTNYNGINLLDGSLAGGATSSKGSVTIGKNVSDFSAAKATGTVAAGSVDLSAAGSLNESIDTFDIDGQTLKIDWSKGEAKTIFDQMKTNTASMTDDAVKGIAEDLTKLFNQQIKEQGLTGGVKVTVGDDRKFSIESTNNGANSSVGWTGSDLAMASANTSLGSNLFSTSATGKGEIIEAGKKFSNSVTAGDGFTMTINGTTVQATVAALASGTLMSGVASAAETAIQNAVTAYNTAMGYGTGHENALSTGDFSVSVDKSGGLKVEYTGDKDVQFSFGEAVKADGTVDKTASLLGLSGSSSKVGGSGGLTLQIGDTAEDFNQLTVSVGNMSSHALGIGGINISTQAGAKAAVDKIRTAINTVSSTRGDLGAIQNRLEHTINNLGVTTENMTAAESRIRDVDMAEEMMAYTKNNILVQASQAMLAQANQLPQGVLQLLQ